MIFELLIFSSILPIVGICAIKSIVFNVPTKNFVAKILPFPLDTILELRENLL